MILEPGRVAKISPRVKDITMRHRGVLGSSARVVGYFVVSSPDARSFTADPSVHIRAHTEKEKERTRYRRLYPRRRYIHINTASKKHMRLLRLQDSQANCVLILNPHETLR